jgi:hypothetical protein
MNQLAVAGASGSQILVYYIFVFISFCYFAYRYRRDPFQLLIILLFFNGLFGFLGKNVQNIYRIVITLMTIYWVLKFKLIKYLKGKSVIVSSTFFTITFLATAFLNGDYIQIIFSQYSRYFILFSLFFILVNQRENFEFKETLDSLIYRLLILQILLSAIKYLIMGTTESIVGSIASQGGAIATLLPVLGLFFIWYKKNGHFDRNDWIFIIGLMFIGFESIKRAIWFIFPVLLTLLIFYVPKRRIPLRVSVISIISIPMIFYLGVRMNPTLNPENKFWGTFNWDYVFNYARGYSFGEGDENVEAYGRGGATLMVYNNLINGEFKKSDFLGYGLRSMYATDYNEFADLGFGISGKGAATGVFQTMVTNGYLGILAVLWSMISMLLFTRNRRLRLVILCYFFWEYFFYTGMSMREPALSFLLIYVVMESAWRPGVDTATNGVNGQA